MQLYTEGLTKSLLTEILAVALGYFSDIRHSAYSVELMHWIEYVLKENC